MPHKRIFISGGAGVIGKALVESLLKEGVELFVGDLKPCPIDWKGKLRYRMGDLNEITEGELQEFAPDLYIHLAATFERSEESPEFFHENYHHNVALSHHLIEKIRLCPSLKKIIFASSYLIYDPKLYCFSKPQSKAINLNEETTSSPRNLCGAAKFFHEEELQFLAKTFNQPVEIIAARIFRVYGKQSRDIISRWIEAAIQNQPLSVYCPESLFDYIFAEDVAEGLLRLANTSYNGIVNLGSGKARAVNDVINLLKTHFPKLKTVTAPTPINCLYEASQADMKRFQSITNWMPAHKLEDAIPKLIAAAKKPKGNSEQTSLGVLISSVSKKAPLIHAVKEAAKKTGISTVFGSDSNSECIGKYLVDQFWNCTKLEDLTQDELLEYCIKHNIKAIIPTRDEELPYYASHKPWLEKKGIHVLVSNAKTIDICLDKKLFADWLTAHHYPSIPTTTDISDLKTSSYVVKERYGAGSKSIALDCHSKQALEHAKKLQSPLFQPFIKGKEYSIDLYRTLKGQVHGCVVRERNLVVNGESQITTTVEKPAIQELCCKLANDLNLYGHAVIQILETDNNKLHIIECNPRFGGASTASLAVGLDSFYWFLLESQGESLEHYPFKRKKGNIKQIRYPTDQIICMK